jgi:hypothetical protein
MVPYQSQRLAAPSPAIRSVTDPGGDPAVDPSTVRPCHLLWTGDLPASVAAFAVV